METIETSHLRIPYPEAEDRHLRINLGACRLIITKGDDEDWITGTYRDSSGLVPIKVSHDAGPVEVSQGWASPNFSTMFSGGVPTLELEMGTAKPYRLTIQSGASDIKLQLGSLPITELVTQQGAGRSIIDFAQPNPQVMRMLTVSAGAAGIEVRNLANANAVVLSLEGGAAGYTFDFGGVLRQDTMAKVSTGVSSVDIIVPVTTAAKISSESFLSQVDVGDGFTSREGAFWTKAAVDGVTPVLTVRASVALGALKLRTAAEVKGDETDKLAATAAATAATWVAVNPPR